MVSLTTYNVFKTNSNSIRGGTGEWVLRTQYRAVIDLEWFNLNPTACLNLSNFFFSSIKIMELVSNRFANKELKKT